MKALPVALALLLPSTALARDRWSDTLDHVSRAVMAIEVSATRSLDTDSATFLSGTGFVVDRDRGILLTNRHMVTVGPVRAKGTTLDHEEVRLTPIYRDPVHDFGFYRFDPADVKYMDLEELLLAPGAAQVGSEIRVVGNDAGEKLSILGGTLARLDRPAPDYGRGSYNDFNTFYYQAATSTSGGSSGSPVVDVKGRVVALNAGGSRDAASSFYLPVTRVQRALQLIQEGKPIPRGTLQAVYSFEPYDELKRLGLRTETEKAFRKRFPKATGMLVVREVLPGGPASDLLQPGDILVRCNGNPIPDFDSMESLLDDNVGRTVRVEVERGGQPLDLTVSVSDLERLTPSRYLEFSQAILQETSLQLARSYNVPARGVLLVEPGYAFRDARIWQSSVLTSVDGVPVPDLDAFVDTLSRLPDGRRVRVEYHTLDNPRQLQVASLRIDRAWSPTRLCSRDDQVGLWSCKEVPVPQVAPPVPSSPPDASFEQSRDPVGALLAPSLCHVRFTVPYRTEGIEGWSYIGVGLVVDAARGLVVTDRGTIPIQLGDADLTFAGSVRVPAQVVFLHPVHNYAILRYDPAALGTVPVKSATLRPDAEVGAGTPVVQVGLTSSHRLITTTSTVSRIDPTGVGTADPPAFREYNSEVFSISESTSTIGGVLADAKGGVVALWAFSGAGSESGQFVGLPIELVGDVLPDLVAGREPVVRDLGVEVEPVTLVDARDRGAPDSWLSKLTQADPERRQAIAVVRVAPEAPAAAVLQGGDILLALDGVPVTRPRQVETLLKRATARVPQGGTLRVRVTRLRGGAVEEVDVEPLILDSQGVGAVVNFAGALIHEPHWQVRLQYGLEPGGVYTSWYWYGGPAARYGLSATAIIRAVNERPVASLDQFLEAVQGLGDAQAVRIQVESVQGERNVTTLETDLVYWPTAHLERTPTGWTYKVLSAP